MKKKYAAIIAAIVVAICLIVLIILKLSGGSEPVPQKNPENSNGNTTITETTNQTGGGEGVQTGDSLSDYLDGVVEPSGSKTNKDGTYLNKQTFQCKDYLGNIITVGVQVDDGAQRIYINPSHSAAKDGNEIGFYISASRGTLEYSAQSMGTPETEGNDAFDNFIVAERYLDSLIPATYVDKDNFGVAWEDDFMFDGKNDGAVITLRCVNAKNRSFYGIFDVTIEMNDKEQYYITGIESADVKNTGELSDEERTDLINQSMTFITDTLGMTPFGKWEDVARGGAVVHKHERTYFPRFVLENFKTGRVSDYSTCKDTYAVNLPINAYGLMTVYFAPKTELMGLTEPRLHGEESMNLMLYGYDAYMFQSAADMRGVVPSDFFN